MSAPHERALEALAQRDRLRALTPRRGADFASNDYLGLAGSPELTHVVRAALDNGAAIGAGGSRLLRGNHREHEALEAEAAAFFGSETTLFFGGGFIANSALFATLPQRGDLIVYDALIHASVHDGMRASRAGSVAAAHNDATAFDDAMTRWRAAGHTGQPWMAVESLYSMDGDRAPLADLMAIADRHDAILVIDEAHATGVWGPEGRGLGAAFHDRANVITLHTCGKALGVMGALLCLPRVFRDFLVNRARPFIYATAPAPLIAAAVRAALAISRFSTDRRARLQQRIMAVGAALEATCGVVPSGSQIQPVIVGSDARAVALALSLQRQGFDIRAIRPPTVPEGTARLRISLTLNVDDRTVDAMLAALAENLKRLPPEPASP